MDKYGLIGYPLTHSFSAKFFNNKFKIESIDAEYNNYEIEDASLIKDIVSENLNLKGINVTIPHKESIIAFLDELYEDAEKIGAVNTIKVVYDNNSYSLTGYNTDYIGFMNSIRPLINPSIHKKALILGTGGASKAVVYALEKLNIEHILVSRTKRDNTITYKDINKDIIKSHNVIINCSPIGTSPKTDECPELPYHFLDSNNLLYDLVYNPSETLFLKSGRERGATTKNGAEMLELQAEAAWRIWSE